MGSTIHHFFRLCFVRSSKVGPTTTKSVKLCEPMLSSWTLYVSRKTPPKRRRHEYTLIKEEQQNKKRTQWQISFVGKIQLENNDILEKLLQHSVVSRVVENLILIRERKGFYSRRGYHLQDRRCSVDAFYHMMCSIPYLRFLLRLFGPPDTLITDNGPQFISTIDVRSSTLSTSDLLRGCLKVMAKPRK